MKYTLPAGFNLVRAQELASLVNAAYDQFTQGPAWALPADYTLVKSLSAREIWKGFGLLANLIPQVIPPVPFGFVATKGTDVYVIIRGTRTPLEWFDDFTAFPVDFVPNGQPWGKVTRGFNLLYNDLRPQVAAALSQIVTEGGSLNSVFLSGHSLGAALAHLAAAGLYAQFHAHPVSYTFSGPRAGEHQFAQTFLDANLPTWRIFNTEDIVPTVPPAAIQMATPNMGMNGLTPVTQNLASLIHLSAVGYQHVGYPVGVTFHREIVADNHNLDYLIAELALPTQ
jgi:triacylglycerol lipase